MMASTNGSGVELEQQTRFILGDESGDRERIDLKQWAAVPQVFIGIGGTGTRTVTCLAERLMDMEFEGGDGGRKLPSCLQFLAFDTDSSEFTSRVKMAGVRTTNLTVDDSANAWSVNEPSFRELGFVEHVKVQGGARAVRKWGRFAFVTHSDKIRKELENALGKAQNDPRLTSDCPRIHVFFSLAGGTGCGIFLDLAFLVRELTQHIPGTEVIGYVVVPDNLVATVPASVLASAASALKELEYFMQLERGNPKFDGWGEAEKFDDTITYRSNGQVRGLIRRPFDYCYLFGSRGSRGQGSVESPSHFSSVLAEAAIRNAFTDSGVHHKKSVVNQDVESYFDQHHQLKYASFSAIGYSRMMLPHRELRAYLVLSSAEILCEYLLKGPPRDADTLADSRETADQFVRRRLVSPLAWDEVVAVGQRGILNSGAALEKLWKENNRNRIKQACDGLKDSFDKIWKESQAVRAEVIATRVGLLEEVIDRRVDELNGGLTEVLDFFSACQQSVAAVRRKCEETAEKHKKELDRDLGEIPKISQFVDKTDIAAWLNASKNLKALKTGFDDTVSKLRDYILARTNAELAATLMEKLEVQTQRLKVTRDAIEDELKAYYSNRKRYFQTRLKGMRFGRVNEDCKTFCPVDTQKLPEQVDAVLESRRRELSQFLVRAGKSGGFKLKSLINGDGTEEIRRRFVELLLEWVKLEDFWQEDGAQRQQKMDKWKGDVLTASEPFLRLSNTSTPVVIGCYANFTEDDLNRGQTDPPDLDKYRTRDVAPLVRQTECCEVTRFFHGIRLSDLPFSKILGDAYRSYMKDLNGSAVLKRDRDTTNLFQSLLHWSPPDKGVQANTTDDYLRVWTMGLCFSEIFPPSEEEKKALDQANKVAPSRGQSVKQDRRNYIFKVGNNYYLQRFYETPTQEAPTYIELGSGRETAFEAFRSNVEAFEEMQKWYGHAAKSWNELFNLKELQAAVGKYLDKLTSLPPSLLPEREVLQKFKQDPFSG